MFQIGLCNGRISTLSNDKNTDGAKTMIILVSITGFDFQNSKLKRKS